MVSINRKIDLLSKRVEKVERTQDLEEDTLLKQPGAAEEAQPEQPSTDENLLMDLGECLFDCHFHLDRMRNKGLIWNKLSHADNLEGGVAVFCDPNSFPSEEALLSLQREQHNIVPAVGIHPAHAGRHPSYLNRAIEELKYLRESGRVKIMGEMGFDFSKPIHPILQEKLFAAQLEVAKSLPIVLHVRGHVTDTDGETVYNHCRNFLCNKVETNQAIQLHTVSDP